MNRFLQPTATFPAAYGLQTYPEGILKGRRISTLVSLLLLLLLLAPCPLRAAHPDGSTVPIAPTAGPAAETNAAVASPPTAVQAGQTTASPYAAPEDIRTLKQRYRQDPTGVRARLGMCRRGHGGHGLHRGQGGGTHRQWRGGERWTDQ